MDPVSDNAVCSKLQQKSRSGVTLTGPRVHHQGELYTTAVGPACCKES